MQTRYRWYYIRIPSGAGDLSKLIGAVPFTAGVGFGFALAESEFGLPRFRFFWRTNVIVTKLEEDGVPAYELVSSISFTDFALISADGGLYLRVENPGRNIRDLLNSLEELVGLGFTVKPITFNGGKVTSLFEQVGASKLVGLKVVGAVIKDDVVARMEFASKQGMVVENMNLLDGVNYKIESAVFEVIYEGIRGQVSFGSTGLVKISGKITPKLVNLIEMDLSDFL
ncbi:hypothetical protein [Chitinimonas koreensis]|uniref:hypothetical protein n=1 Tax=Chitinimonas koreensis TaxID=356302 RepID=UPI0006842DA9|nr:hypothetical protein [Chitinimonas koreensis]